MIKDAVEVVMFALVVAVVMPVMFYVLVPVEVNMLVVEGLTVVAVVVVPVTVVKVLELVISELFFVAKTATVMMVVVTSV